MVGTEALERILGKRPFHSEEMRNIDKFRDGFQLPVAAAAADVASPTGSAAPGDGGAPTESLTAADQPAAGSPAAGQAAADRQQGGPSIPRGSIVAS